MDERITSMIPHYGKLNKIYTEIMSGGSFSFEKQQFISGFYGEYGDTQTFETALISLMLEMDAAHFSILLNSLKKRPKRQDVRTEVLQRKDVLKNQARKKLKLQFNKTIKFISLIVFAAAITFIASQNGFCNSEVANQIPAIAEQAPDVAKHEAIIKFAIAMAGVMLSSFVIFAGLWIYNKFFVDKSLFPNNDKDDVLNTPKTVEEAVTFFIKRNKLC